MNPLQWITRRAGLTSGAVVMLPVYPILWAWVGGWYVWGDPTRTQITKNSALIVAVSIAPIRTWGWVFLAISVLIVAGYIAASRAVAIVGLCLAAGAMTCWAFMLLWSSAEHDASMIPPALYVTVAIAHLASARSLARDRMGWT